MSTPIHHIDNNPRAFNPEFLDAKTYFIQKKRTFLCLIAEVDNSDHLHDTNNIKCHHVKDPVYFAPILGDGNCGPRAVVLSLLMQGVLDNKQLFIAEKLRQIFRENKDRAKEIYDIDPPKDFDRFIEEYCALTPDKCAPFFKRFSAKSKNNKIFEFLMTCLRLDIFDFCKNNYTDELVSTFASKQDFVLELNKLPVLKEFIDAEFPRFYLQNYHNISINVYQLYEGYKELDPGFYSEDNNLRQDQRSQDLHLNLVFANDHFEVVVFKKDIDQYLERNKDKWLEKPLGCSLANSLPNGPSVINKKQTQSSIPQIQTQTQKKALDPRVPSFSEPINDSQRLRKTLPKARKKNESEALKNRLDKWPQSSNDPVINKEGAQSSPPRIQKRIQKKKVLDPLPPSFSEPIKDSQRLRRTLPKVSEENKDTLLIKRFNLLKKYLFSQDSVVNEKSVKDALRYLMQDLKRELMAVDQSSSSYLDHPAQSLLTQAQLILNQSDESEEQLREDAKKLKEILIQHQEEKLNFYFEQNKLLKKLDLIEKYLSKMGEPTVFPALKKSLKKAQISESWQSSLDSLDRTLLNQAKPILMRSGTSEKQLQENSKELIKIYTTYQQEKSRFSPGLLCNKNAGPRRQQENEKNMGVFKKLCQR